jgi:hypothetical protein
VGCGSMPMSRVGPLHSAQAGPWAGRGCAGSNSMMFMMQNVHAILTQRKKYLFITVITKFISVV